MGKRKIIGGDRGAYIEYDSKEIFFGPNGVYLVFKNEQNLGGWYLYLPISDSQNPAPIIRSNENGSLKSILDICFKYERKSI